jgi:hypothetical protein
MKQMQMLQHMQSFVKNNYFQLHKKHQTQVWIVTLVRKMPTHEGYLKLTLTLENRKFLDMA